MKAIRKVYSMYDPNKKAAIEKATVRVYGRNKDGSESKSYRVYVQCSKCAELCAKGEYDVDHINPVGKSPVFPYETGELETWIKRLFCPLGNLQILCKPCHKAKCYNEKKRGAYEKANLRPVGSHIGGNSGDTGAVF